MSDPIDILEIASQRRHAAVDRFRGTLAMRASEEAEVAAIEATVQMKAAQSDLEAALWFAGELTQAANVIA
jgi:hypothetical protein